MPLLHHITIRNLLSFGEKGISLPLRPLNVLIGPNGAGKSNLIDVISLFRASPKHLATPVQTSGGMSEWRHKPSESPVAQVEAIVDATAQSASLRHHMEFGETGRWFVLVEEFIETEYPKHGDESPFSYYCFRNRHATIDVMGTPRELDPDDIQTDESILSQRKDPDQFPEITFLAETYEKIKIYREWAFGRNITARVPQRADERNDCLDENCSNLGLMLNKLRRDPSAKARVLEWLQRAYEGINDFDVIIEGGSVQVFLQEGRVNIPATRLSDGTLRYLCLLAILCHPNPPPLVCIEEPELGLHPDLVVAVGELLKEASERMQLIVTTHSPAILDVLSRTPEDVIVCEKEDGATVVTRLDATDLSVWMDEYSLGQLWRRGEIGGNRW